MASNKLSRETLNRLENEWGPDPLDDGTIIAFQKQFDEDGKIYSYAAIRGGDKYFITGREGGLYWFNLLNFIEDENVLDAEFDVLER